VRRSQCPQPAEYRYRVSCGNGKPFHDVSRATAHAKKRSGFCSSQARVPTQLSLNLSECLEIVGVKKMMGVRDARSSAVELGSN
jgi:hypothetical protein